VAKLVVVYNTVESEAHKVAAILVGHGLNPVVFDRSSTFPDNLDYLRTFRVFVPAEEYDEAARILAEIDHRNDAKAIPVMKRANGVLLLIMILATVLVLVAALVVVTDTLSP